MMKVKTSTHNKQNVDSLLTNTYNLNNFLNLDRNNDIIIIHTVIFMYERFIKKPVNLLVVA